MDVIKEKEPNKNCSDFRKMPSVTTMTQNKKSSTDCCDNNMLLKIHQELSSVRSLSTSTPYVKRVQEVNSDNISPSDRIYAGNLDRSIIDSNLLPIPKFSINDYFNSKNDSLDSDNTFLSSIASSSVCELESGDDDIDGCVVKDFKFLPPVPVSSEKVLSGDLASENGTSCSECNISISNIDKVSRKASHTVSDSRYDDGTQSDSGYGGTQSSFSDFSMNKDSTACSSATEDSIPKMLSIKNDNSQSPAYKSLKLVSLSVPREKPKTIPTSPPRKTSHKTPADVAVSLSFDEVMSKFSPSPGAYLIGRKIGRNHVDIITQLQSQNLLHCVGKIMEHLTDKDLTNVIGVSKTWKIACLNDSKANRRRMDHVNEINTKKKSVGKENFVHKSPSKQTKDLLNTNRQALSYRIIQPTVRPGFVYSPTSPSKTQSRHDIFMQTAQSLKVGESLHQCPKCKSPALTNTAEERAVCIRESCLYDYCMKCLCEYHGAKLCTGLSSAKKSTSTGKNSVGSKKSKKNLRRL